MTLFSISFAYLSFYCLALFLAFWRARSKNAPKSHNSVAAMTIGAVGTLLIYVSSLLAPQGSAPLVLVAALVLVPIFLLGLGSILGIWIATWRGQHALQAILAVFFTGVPILAVFAFDLGPTQRPTRIGDQQNGLVAFQKTDVTGRLGRYPITLPVSPQIDTYYTCIDTDTGTITECRTHFGLDAVLMPTPGDVPVFHHIHVARKSEDCTVACINFERLDAWCRTRSDVALQDWCATDPADEFELSYDENRAPGDDTERGWTTPETDFGDTEVRCRISDASRTCRARYDIARNLQVTIWIRETDDADLTQRLESAQNYVARLWASMQRDT